MTVRTCLFAGSVLAMALVGCSGSEQAAIVSPANSVAGASMTVSWKGPGNSADYIDVVPRGFKEVAGEIAYTFVRDSNGTVVLRAPTTPGDYDVRYVSDLSGARSIAAIVPLTVVEAQATLQGPAAAETGQTMSVAWTGPNGPGDYIDLVSAGMTSTTDQIAYVFTRAGSPAILEAPSATGDYQIRYVLEGPGGRKVRASKPLKVTVARATLTAPAITEKGRAFKVEWTGPNSTRDYVDLVKKGVTSTGDQIDYFYTGAGGPGELTAPESGEYDIRYILDAPGGRVILATQFIIAN